MSDFASVTWVHFFLLFWIIFYFLTFSNIWEMKRLKEERVCFILIVRDVLWIRCTLNNKAIQISRHGLETEDRHKKIPKILRQNLYRTEMSRENTENIETETCPNGNAIIKSYTKSEVLVRTLLHKCKVFTFGKTCRNASVHSTYSSFTFNLHIYYVGLNIGPLYFIYLFTMTNQKRKWVNWLRSVGGFYF